MLSRNERVRIAIRGAAGLGLGTLGVAAIALGQSTARPVKVVEMVAERFSFTPSEVSVEAGTTLEIRLTSEDTAHGFRILGPGDVNVDIPKRGRGEARVTFSATEPGTFTFECSHVCGAGHGFMRGSIRVVARRSAPTAAIP
jgi:cytochrome c oxidase subunit 2